MKPSERETRTRGVGPGWGALLPARATDTGRPVLEREEGETGERCNLLCVACFIRTIRRPSVSLLSCTRGDSPSGWNFSSDLHVCPLVSARIAFD